MGKNKHQGKNSQAQINKKIQNKTNFPNNQGQNFKRNDSITQNTDESILKQGLFSQVKKLKNKSNLKDLTQKSKLQKVQYKTAQRKQSCSDFSSEDFQEKLHKINVNFTIKQWFLLGVQKLIPHKDKSIKIDISKNQLKGQKQKIEKFYKVANKKLNQMKIKILKLKVNISTQQIEIHMEGDWDCKVFSPNTLKIIGEKIKKYYGVQNQIDQVIKSILERDRIDFNTRFIWIKQENYQEASKLITQIHRKYMEEQKSILQYSFNKVLPDFSMMNISMTNENSKDLKYLSEENKKQKSSNQDQAGKSQNVKKPKVVNSQPTKQSNLRLIKQPKLINPSKSTKQTKESLLFKQLQMLLDDSGQFSIIQPAQQTIVQKELTKEVSVNRRGNRRFQQRKILFTQAFPQQHIDKNHLQTWIKKNRSLDIQDLQIKQKFSPEQDTLYLEIFYYGDDPKGKKMYSLDIYFKHQKVIKLDYQQSIRNKVKQKFQCDHPWLKVSYKKIYAKQRHLNYEQLRLLCNKDTTAQYKYQKNINMHHALLVTGLVTQVTQFQSDLLTFITECQQSCRKEEVIVKFKNIAEFIRQKKVLSFIQHKINQFFKTQTDKYKVIQIRPIYNDISIDLQVYNIEDKNISKIIDDLQQKLQNLIETFDYDYKTYKNCKSIFQTLNSKYLFLQNKGKGITLISSTKQISKHIALINVQIQKINEPIMKEYSLKQKSQLTISKDYLNTQSISQEFKKVRFRYEELQNNFKIIFFGPQSLVDQLIQKVEQYIQSMSEKIYQYHYELTEQELEIIQKDKSLQKKIQQTWKITLKFKKNYKTSAQLVIQPHSKGALHFPQKIIFFQKEFNFLSLPSQSIFVFRSKKQIQSIKQSFITPLKNQINYQNQASYQDKSKKCWYLFEENQSDPQTIIQICSSLNKEYKNIYLNLPQDQKQAQFFINQLIKTLGKSTQIIKKYLGITIIGKAQTNFKKIIKYEQGKVQNQKQIFRKWFTMEGHEKLYYSQDGNKKIEQAIKQNTNSIQLTNQDLNLVVKTHAFQFEKATMTHLRSGLVTPLKISSNNISFILNGKQKKIPGLQYKKIKKFGNLTSKQLQDCQLSIGFYQIDLNNKTQTNLFSKFERKLYYQETQEQNTQKFNIQVNYDIQIPKLVIEYSESHLKFVSKVQELIETYLQQKLITVEKDISQTINIEALNQLKTDADEQSISIDISTDKKTVKLSSYSQKKITNFLKLVQRSTKKGLQMVKNNQIMYPKEWEAQSKQIQTFIVANGCDQFNRVQTGFKCGKIVELLRIQNKTVYKRYFDQKQFLKQLNQGKNVKEMLLYHGTKKTDPKMIYQDKQQCFNINYTSEKNLLGKGIYFAQKSQYSLNYSYAQNQVGRHGGKVYSMFLCQVLVGESQKCPGHSHDIKDTSYKDVINGIKYQSMTDFLQGSNVYVVYKSKRAYPLYLIKFTIGLF